MSLYTIARFFLIAGVVLIAVAGVLFLAARFGLPIGRLPGDIVIRRGGGTLYFPITTSILVSVALTVLVNLIVRFLNR
ncbi:MAG TPA: DUF2905 domain-containing protein [Anaerolineales bacterium]|nr:DUF2905 domain-containing protein [Anaerolineales bacterium]